MCTSISSVEFALVSGGKEKSPVSETLCNVYYFFALELGLMIRLESVPECFVSSKNSTMDTFQKNQEEPICPIANLEKARLNALRSTSSILQSIKSSLELSGRVFILTSQVSI
jgi:hypothetical protein